MKKFTFKEIEKRWRNYWKNFKIFQNNNLSKKSKCYILDMFPYPSGAGLHVGHSMGYIASDIYARYKILNGFNVLHPIGFDSFGLPTEQYAIQTGQHPEITTAKNITRYKDQMEKMGLSFDWRRQIKTSDPFYYKWTQWIFIQFFNSWYDLNMEKSRPIEELKQIFDKEGNLVVKYISSQSIKNFTSKEWKFFSKEKKELVLQKYRLAFRKITTVNWCPSLGTVLSNNEIKDGKSELGGFTVYKKKMIQWSLRITAYAERLLKWLKKTNWSNELKVMQTNWIGKSTGVIINFTVINNKKTFRIKSFTTKTDKIFNVNFLVLSTENPIIENLTNIKNKNKVQKYLKEYNKNNTFYEKISGIFIGTYSFHPLIKYLKLPIYISNYVLHDYGTGAIMGVSYKNKWDYKFYKKFKLKSFYSKKEKQIKNKYIYNIKQYKSINELLEIIITKKIVYKKRNYNLIDAIFSRQRYWGEPIPIYYKKQIAFPISENKLPLFLPLIKKYLPSKKGNPPLSRSIHWAWDEKNKKIRSNKFLDHKYIFPIEKNTMPVWAGSSWYFLRYMSPKNNFFFVDKKSEFYWQNVDLYLGGAEHATGHLIYSRIFQKFLKDREWVTKEEPFKKIINQGMIIGQSALIARIKGTKYLVSAGLVKNNEYYVQKIYIDINLLKNDKEVDLENLKKWRTEFLQSKFLLEKNVKFLCYKEREKMSKSKYNVINPDKLFETYGADTLRIYEMFLGPIQQAKPWNIRGIKGIQQFLNKFFQLLHFKGVFYIEKKTASKENVQILHHTIKKVKEYISQFYFNTAISTFMISINQFNSNKCNNIEIIEPLIILLSPFAPYLTEELWHKIGNKYSVYFSKMIANIPESIKKDMLYNITISPILVNGKLKLKIKLSKQIKKEEILKIVLNLPKTYHYFNKNQIKTIIFIQNKILNLYTKIENLYNIDKVI